ncbi:unnamed protein product [Adineta steineri]|uniref:Uncharacterized protein n=1 Tax=Adineta steineri TaxID=433720 RepID=A0A818VDB8_9BILA|nr:unnamed protein product [Adineta steineri]CAF3709533.1 unnamed protein product [Adineta steineri]
MELNQIPLSQTNSQPSIEGDPATYKFAMFLISALAIITIGSIIGIAAGNAAHYDYFEPNNITNISVSALWNVSILSQRSLGNGARLWLTLAERIKRSNMSIKTRSTWLIIKKPTNNRRW